MLRRPRRLGAAFTALLAAAGFTVDGVLGALPEDCRGRVSRSTLYDWKKGQRLPLDATGPLLEVVRVCLAAAGERGGTLGVSPGSEDGWRRLLAEAKQAPDADIARGRRTSGGEPGSAWSGRAGRALGAGELPRRAVSRLLEETGGNPLYCRAVLEEAGRAVTWAAEPLRCRGRWPGWCGGG